MSHKRNFLSGSIISRAVLALFLGSGGILLAITSFTGLEWRSGKNASRMESEEKRERYSVGGTEELAEADEMEADWHNRLTYPTGLFDAAWVRAAAGQDAQIARGLPLGTSNARPQNGTPATLDPTAFTAMG